MSTHHPSRLHRARLSGIGYDRKQVPLKLSPGPFVRASVMSNTIEAPFPASFPPEHTSAALRWLETTRQCDTWHLCLEEVSLLLGGVKPGTYYS